MSVAPMLAAAEARRDKHMKQMEDLLAPGVAEGRSSLTDEEKTTFEKLGRKLTDDDEAIVGLQAQHAREVKAASVASASEQHHSPAVVSAEPQVYHPDNKRGGSYFLDLGIIAAASEGLGVRDPAAALERMERNDREYRVEMRKPAELMRRGFSDYIDREGGSYEARVNPNTTFGTGGEFVPPLWLVSQFAPLLRADRVAANRVSNRPLPPGIDVINLPKITTGSLTGTQASQGGAVASRDIVTSTVSATVRTLAGQEDISLQLLEQSPLQMDGVIFDDLQRDLWLQLDTQILTGSGANGQHQGVLTQTNGTSNTSITSASAVTCGSIVFADATTSGTQTRSILSGINQIETLRIAGATGIWAHPRRVNSWQFGADTQGRPLFVPYSPFNAFGLSNPNIPEGVAGVLFGLPVVKDGNMPTTCVTGAVTGGTGDAVAVLKEDDLILWEGTPRFRALPEILSGTLQVRYQVYQYSAFMPNRFPPSTSIITGTTGLAAPAF